MFEDFLKNNYEKIKSILTKQDLNVISFQIKKRNDSFREIISPNKEYKILLRSLNSLIKNYYKPLDNVHGFLVARSIKTNALNHIAKSKILKIDLSDFFNTITKQKVKELFEQPIFKLKSDDSEILSSFCTLNGYLPQGFPTSPILSNFIFSPVDEGLNNLAQKYSLIYTRYADDLVFSSNSPIVDDIFKQINEFISASGFSINRNKTKYIGKHRCQIITGIVVNKKLSVKRCYKKIIRAILHSWEIHGLKFAEKKYLDTFSRNRLFKPNKFLHSLEGKIEFVGFICGKDNPDYISFKSKYAQLSTRDYNDILYSPIPEKQKSKLSTSNKTENDLEISDWSSLL